MSNRINEVVTTLKERDGITYREIAERCKISEQTLHSARKRKSMDFIHVDVFLKIAHGLGMTAEELYYGECPDRNGIDHHERHIIDVYRSASDHGRTLIDAVIDGEARHMDESAFKETEESEGNRRIG